MKITVAITLLLGAMVAAAQDSIPAKQNRLLLSGYGDIYYQYDGNKPAAGERPGCLYNFKRNEKPSVNLALLKASLLHQKWKVNLAVMAGDYATYNLAAEPVFFRYINEANIRYSFSDKFSAEAGILPSHIGMESAVAKDNWNLSRSLLAENSPYYETGIKLNYSFGKKWVAAVMLLNGWQNIKDNNSDKAIGTQVQFMPCDKWLLNSSSFIGNEKTGSVKQLRLFHNFYSTYSFNTKCKAAFLLDAGSERKITRDGWNNWMGAAAFFQYAFTATFSAAARMEWYKDKTGVIVSAFLPQAFTAAGWSVNADLVIHKNISLRTEARLLTATEKIFETNTSPSGKNFSLLTVLAVFF